MRGSEARCTDASQRGRLERLMEAYQGKDESALDRLVDELSPALMRFFLGPTVTRPQAEDLLQELWLRVHRVRHTYSPGRPVLPWIFAIARYTRADEYRRIRRGHPLQPVDTELAPDLRSRPEAVDAEIDFRTLVNRLPSPQREVVLKVGGLTLAEAARSTGSTVGATKQMAHRAYTNLRSMAQILNHRTNCHGAATDA